MYVFLEKFLKDVGIFQIIEEKLIKVCMYENLEICKKYLEIFVSYKNSGKHPQRSTTCRHQVKMLKIVRPLVVTLVEIEQKFRNFSFDSVRL